MKFVEFVDYLSCQTANEGTKFDVYATGRCDMTKHEINSVTFTRDFVCKGLKVP